MTRFGTLLVYPTLLVLLMGCASSRGIPEFQVYRSTFESTEATLSAVIDAFEPVERETTARLARTIGYTPLRFLAETPTEAEMAEAAERINDNAGFDPDFHIVDAVYYADGQAPPTTAAFRNALAAVRHFNDAAAAYAEGRALDQIEGQLLDLQRALGTLAGVVTDGSDLLPVPLPGGAAVSTALEVLDQALLSGQRAAFRDAIREIAPIIDTELLLPMRNAAPSMFRLLSGPAQDAAVDADDDGDTVERDRQVAIVERYRIVMSNWVISLDATRGALQRVVAAIDAPDTPASLLGDLTATIENTAAVAATTRRLLADIRASQQ